MMVLLMIFGFLVIGALAWWLENNINIPAKVIALVSTVTALALFLFYISSGHNYNNLTIITDHSWIDTVNIRLTLALDHLSIILIILTLILALISILISWREIKRQQGFYYFNLLFTVAGIIGVFTAVDMFAFFFFWEVMLLPMTALIAIWGHENRHFAATKFFIFTQVSSLAMLISILVMAYWHQQVTGVLSFSYLDWLNLDKMPELAYYVMLGFFIAFAVKLPIFPVHSWLPDAHTQAPTAGSVLLAGVLLKTGAYGLIRFVVELFPNQSADFAPIAAILAIIGILYCAKMAFAQTDFKRLVAYSSVSHMGFVLLALFSFNANAYKGAIVTMVAHGLSSSALFCVAGMLYARLETRELNAFGGLWSSAPKLAGYDLAFSAAAFGLPGLANFVGEFYYWL